MTPLSETEAATDRVREYAGKCEAIGNDKRAGIVKRAMNRSVATAIRHALDGDAKC